MILSIAMMLACIVGMPRASGDDPLPLKLPIGERWYAPRKRG